MILGFEQLGECLRVAALVGPVAVYFLIVGLLNSRQRPQLISGRRDFAIMLVAVSPLFLSPIIQVLGLSFWSLLAGLSLVFCGIWLFAPRGHSWVIYNLPADEAGRLIKGAMARLGIDCGASQFSASGGAGGLSVKVSSFPVLRNMSVKLTGCDNRTAMRFQAELSRRLAATPSEATATAMVMLLLATAMLIVPLTMVVQQVPDIVRLLTDMFH
ncbi:MAG: hypothetical protein HZA50_18815 [Planctomycetes bacterium]|nr:hypothetical protein [Planctomycetota bacterium]